MGVSEGLTDAAVVVFKSAGLKHNAGLGIRFLSPAWMSRQRTTGSGARRHRAVRPLWRSLLTVGLTLGPNGADCESWPETVTLKEHAVSAHRFLHEGSDFGLVGCGQLLGRVGHRRHGPLVEVALPGGSSR